MKQLKASDKSLSRYYCDRQTGIYQWIDLQEGYLANSLWGLPWRDQIGSRSFKALFLFSFCISGRQHWMFKHSPLQERMQNVVTQDSHFAFVVVLVLGKHPNPSLSCKKWFQHRSPGNCILKLTQPNKLSLMKPSKLCLLAEHLGQ